MLALPTLRRTLDLPLCMRPIDGTHSFPSLICVRRCTLCPPTFRYATSLVRYMCHKFVHSPRSMGPHSCFVSSRGTAPLLIQQSQPGRLYAGCTLPLTPYPPSDNKSCLAYPAVQHHIDASHRHVLTRWWVGYSGAERGRLQGICHNSPAVRLVPPWSVSGLYGSNPGWSFWPTVLFLRPSPSSPDAVVLSISPTCMRPRPILGLTPTLP